MREYGISLRSYWHDYTPHQIRTLYRQITRRKLEDQRHEILFVHGDAEALLESVNAKIKDFSPSTPPVMPAYDESVWDKLNVNTEVISPE